ncbi:hypothetical protein DRN93_05690 [archaeon]|nr:MAG: hypothetical protein DRN93_05690 [archaeon]
MFIYYKTKIFYIGGRKMPEFDFKDYISTAQSVVVGIVAIALAGGIGSYILAQFNNGTGNQITEWVNLLNGRVSMISTVITILLVAVIALVGIGLIKLMTKTTE